MAVQQHVLNWLYSVLTSEYQDVNRTYNDVAQALSQFPSLSPRTDVHTFSNGASALLLHLSGTLPAVFRGTTYRYPISVWVPHAYPREAPLVYVTPTENMMVRPGQHVDPQGQVYHPYLMGWSEFWDKSSIVDFLAILRDVFAKEPPVIARQSVRPSPSTAATPSPPPIPPFPQELAAHHSAAAFQLPTPPPKPSANVTTTTSTSTTPQNSPTPSPPPVPPHPHADSSAAANSIAGMLHDARLGYTGTAIQTPHSPSPPPPPRPPPVPGRPSYQQSPLGQPPHHSHEQQQNQQQQYQTPFRSDLPLQQQPPPLQTQPPPSFATYDPRQPATAAYYAYAQQQQQQQQQQQLAYAQQGGPSPPWQQLQPQPRPKGPPPPDIMDEDDNAAVAASQGTTPGDASSQHHPAHEQLSTPPPPPPVPPNPEKDMLLHELGRVLAQARIRSRDQDASTLAGLQAQRSAMLDAASRLQQDMSEVAQLSALLTSNTNLLHESLAAADGVIQRGHQTRPPAIDDLLVAPTVVAGQLYDLVAEERALADSVFMLGRAVEHGRISPAVFAKMTRSLAREWYLKKALVRKVARGMGLASV